MYYGGMTSKGYHHVYDAHYHIVFPVKYRRALLRDDITKALKEIAQSLADRYDCEMEEIGCDNDHIHLLCSFAPTYSGGQFVRLFKSITAKKLFEQFPDLRKELWGGEFWSDGYYLATVGKRGSWDIVQNYVKNQGTGNTDITNQLRLL